MGKTLEPLRHQGPVPLVPASTPEKLLTQLHGALQARGDGTVEHAERVIHYAMTLGRLLKLSPEELVTLKLGVSLHDIGKLCVPDHILQKPGALSKAEWAMIKQHPSLGYALISEMPSLYAAARIVLTHHEWYDGTGYPSRLKGQQIPLTTRICSVADTLDALTSKRPYREPVTVAEAYREIWSECRTHFDPLVVEALMSIHHDDWALPQILLLGNKA